MFDHVDNIIPFNPWSIPGADEGVDYDPAQFPEAQRHCETHFGMTKPLRAPNGTDVAVRVAEAFQKVFSSAGQLDPDQILAEKK